MEIVKVKGQPNRFFLKDVKMFYVTEPSWWDWAWRGLKITFRQGEFQGKEIFMSFAGERKSGRQKGVSSFPRTHAGELMVVVPRRCFC